MTSWRIIPGDCRQALAELEPGSVRTCVTSPPYFGLRDYGHDGQIGLEPTPDEFVAAMVDVFREVRRVLADDGTLWLNLGDTYGSGKQLLGIPWCTALALRNDGWILRSDIIWAKPNPVPESVTDRPTKAHEYLFLLSKRPRYFYNADAIREEHETLADDPDQIANVKHWSDRPNDSSRSKCGLGTTHMGFAEGGRNKRSVWTVGSDRFPGAHFATFPVKLIEPCILAGSGEGEIVLDPFAGAGTTGMVALRHGRSFIGCEINPEFVELARGRIIDDAPLLNVFSHLEEAA